MKIEINKGDIIYTGKFKNKKQEVKSMGEDEHGQPTANGRKVLTFRMEKLFPKTDVKETKMKKSELRKIVREEIQKLNELDNTKINKVIRAMKKEKVDPDYASPNYVADFAYSRGIKLTSAEVVYISDNFGR